MNTDPKVAKVKEYAMFQLHAARYAEAAAKRLCARADADGRKLTPEEWTKLDALKETVTVATASVVRLRAQHPYAFKE